MIRRITDLKERKDEGFSLVELLVVIIIIGILAAIAIPVFMNQRGKANDTAAKADVSTIGKEIATLWVDSATLSGLTVAQASGRWTLTHTGLSTPMDLGPVSNGVVPGATPLTVVVEPGSSASDISRNDWCVWVTHPEGTDKDFRYTANGGIEKGNCTPSAATP